MQRTEASSTISEFNLTEVGKEKVKLNDLIKTLKKTTAHSKVKSQLKSASKQKTLPVPLSKPESEKIKRTVAYEKITEEVGKWDSIVRTNRQAEQIVFPLKKPEFRLETTEEVAKRFKSKNALEEEVSKLLSKSENVLDQNKVLTDAEEKALKAMSLAEAKARHAELRKMRALLSFKEAKARRQNKIKSKKYRRILRKERMKKLMKEFEELQKTDPEAAEEKIKETDKLRILERITLKHRSTGKWARQQKLRAKYNTDSRIALKEQLTLGRQLTEKVVPTGRTYSIHDEFSQSNDLVAVSDVEEEDELLNMYRINCDVGDHQEKQVLPVKDKIYDKVERTKISAKSLVLDDDEEAPVEEPIEETLERRQTMEDFENLPQNEWLPVTNNNEDDQTDAIDISKDKSSQQVEKVAEKKKIQNNYVTETDFTLGTKILDSMVPDDITYGDEGVDDVQEDRIDITQAFADEDFIAEFKEVKAATERKEQPSGMSLYLPGWGSWGGAGIKTSKRKHKRFYIKPPSQPRKDCTLGNVIISEEKDSKASVHQVSDLPFPYKSVHAFQSIIRQPLGSTWNPETSFHKLNAPKVITKMGRIIDPMDKEDLVLEKKASSQVDDDSDAEANEEKDKPLVESKRKRKRNPQKSGKKFSKKQKELKGS